MQRCWLIDAVFLGPQIRIIDKSGPLDNFADRDHCIQYMVAVPRASVFARGPFIPRSSSGSAQSSTAA
jgi:hypothetical protein